MEYQHTVAFTGRRLVSDQFFPPRRMMIVLLLLAACCCVGYSYETEEYGNTFMMRLVRKAQTLELTQEHRSEPTVLWKRDDPPAREDSRRRVSGSYFVIDKLTQRDSGRYIMRDKDGIAVSVRTIAVVASRSSFERVAGKGFNFAYNLEPNSCHIYFYPTSDYDGREIHLVYNGRFFDDQYLCTGFEFLEPCGLFNDDLQESCSGRFEVRDSKGNNALVVTLEVEAKPFDPSKIGIGIGIFFAVISCCTCLRRCCCGKSSSKKDESETPEAEPAVHYHEYDHEPVGPRPEQVSRPSGMQPSYTPTDPLIHNPPTMSAPPAYSEVFGLTDSDAPALSFTSDALSSTADTPAPPYSSGAPSSNPEPRFELKGMTFASAPPLSSDSAYSDVYTSDKLSFR